MSFTLNGSPPPFEAEPDWEHGPVLRYPRWEARCLNGRPVRAVGWPRIEFGRATVTPCGIRWWLQPFNGSAAWASVCCTVLDPATDTWVNASGVLWRPSWGQETVGGCMIQGFQATFIATCW